MVAQTQARTGYAVPFINAKKAWSGSKERDGRMEGRGEASELL